MTPEEITAIQTRNESRFKELIDAEYKNNFHNDPTRREYHTEVHRAKWVLFINPNEDWGKSLRRNAVARSIIEELTGQEVVIEKKERRTDKYQKLIEWCKENHLRQFTAQDLCEVADISYPTALKFTKDRPDLVHKIKKGLYEARDPEIMRKEEKDRQNK